MRVFKAELMRIIKTRSIQLILLAMVVLAVVMAYFPISFVQFTYADENGKEVTVKGLEAIRLTKENQGQFAGEITPEKMALALGQYQEFAGQYEDGLYDEDVKDSDINKYILPVNEFVTRLKEVYADEKNGLAAGAEELTRDEALGFYSQCTQHLKDLMNLEQSEHPKARRQAEKLYENVKMPFKYYPGIDSNTMDYLALWIFLLVIAGAIIAAPVFSSDSQTGADQILRCTKHGKRRLAAVKIVATLAVVTVMYFVCVGIFTLITNTVFGWESRQTSMQILFSAVSFLPLNLGTLQNITIAAGYVTMVATVLFTLFLSSRMRSVVSSSVTALIFSLVPVMIYTMMGGNNLFDWLRSIFPSSGVGLGNCFMYSLMDTAFVHAGSFSAWIPFVIMAAAVIEIPVFIYITVRGYCGYLKR